MYLTYYSKIKGHDPLIFGRKEEYVANINQLESEPHVE